ncbi:MAG: hypothetical protein LBK71_00430 [Verrucomicrobiales bacterium]|jgi:hypothetical protein|nr:hypothetical protein [Verrucomicrobiales bacterium]
MNKAAFLGGGIGLLVLILSVSGWLLLKARLASQLAAELSRALNAEVRIASVSVRPLGGEIRLRDGALASRDPAAHWQRAAFAQAGVRFNFSDLFAPVIPLTVTIDGATLVLRTPAAAAAPVADGERPAPTVSAGRWPRLRVQTVSVRNLTVSHADDAAFVATGVGAEVDLDADQDRCAGSVSGAALRAGEWSLTDLAGQVTRADGQWRVEQFRAAIAGGSVSGSAVLPDRAPARIRFNLDRVPAAAVLNAKWSVIISGLASGAGDYTGDPFAWRAGAATGSLTLTQAAFKAPPFLLPAKQLLGLSVAAGDLSLDEARADFHYAAGDLSLTDLRLAKHHLLALRGAVTVSGGLLSGELRLGLPAAAPLPPRLKAEVFTADDGEGYQWAPFTVSGTPGQWREDLSPRIRQAIGEEGRQLLDQMKGKTKERFDKVREKAGRWLDQILQR